MKDNLIPIGGEQPEMFEGVPQDKVQLAVLSGDVVNWNNEYLAFRKKNIILKEHISAQVVQAAQAPGQHLIGKPQAVCMVTAIIYYTAK